MRRAKSSFLHHLPSRIVKDPPSEALENIRLQGVINEKRVAQVVWFMKEGVRPEGECREEGVLALIALLGAHNPQHQAPRVMK